MEGRPTKPVSQVGIAAKIDEHLKTCGIACLNQLNGNEEQCQIELSVLVHSCVWSHLVHWGSPVRILQIDVGIDCTQVHDDVRVGLGTGKVKGSPETGKGKEASDQTRPCVFRV